MSANPSVPGVSTDWAYRGQPAVVMENARLRLVLLPGLGGKISSLVDKRADAELLWLNDRVPARPVAFGSSYDDQFLGGWDELYPNDEAEILAGEAMPDHGEIWALPWTWTTGREGDAVWVELAVRTPITSSSITKRITMRTDSTLAVDYRLTNTGRTDQPFLWKSHVALRLRPDTRMTMGALDVLVHEFGSPRARPPDGRLSWPRSTVGGVEHDFQELPDTSARGVVEFLLATRMERGQCGVEHPSTGTGLELEWSLDDLPSCWLFSSFGGGWRGHDVVVVEPCTGYPLSVAEGVAAGTHQTLAAGATKSWQLTARVGAPTA